MALLKNIIFIIFFIPVFIYSSQQFVIKQSCDSSYDKDIYLFEAGLHVGSISYKKIPVVPWYVIYNLYVYPSYRNKGYGQQLLSYSCSVLQQKGAKRIYIQPGPFEIVNGSIVEVDGALYEQAIKRLMIFYQKNGFEKVAKITAQSAAMLYRIMKIDEDSRYLLVKCFN